MTEKPLTEPSCCSVEEVSSRKIRFRVNWAFRDGSSWIRGHDIVVSENMDFDEEDAMDLMDKIMFPCEEVDKERMPNFSVNTCADSPQTWKVLSIRKLKADEP